MLTDISVQQLHGGILYAPASAAGRFSRARTVGIGPTEALILPSLERIRLPFNSLDPSTRIEDVPSAPFVVYGTVDTSVNSVTRTTRLYRNGASNPELQLNYATFALTEMVAPGDGRRADRTTILGLETGFATAPRTGRGIYRGVLHGSSVGSGPDGDWFSLLGTARLEFDWPSAILAGRLIPTATNLRTDQSLPLGDFTLTNAQPRFGSAFQAVIGGVPGAVGFLNGRLYGPTGEEALGVFELVTPGAGVVLAAQGLVATRRESIEPSAGTPPPPFPPALPLPEPAGPINPALDGLTRSETFLAEAARLTAIYPVEGTSPLPSESGQLTVAFDAASGTYTLSTAGTAIVPAASAAFAPSSRVAGESDSVATVTATARATRRTGCASASPEPRACLARAMWVAASGAGSTRLAASSGTQRTA